MEDYIIREIDRIGEMLMLVAKRLGLFLDDVLLQQEAPVRYLVEQEKLSDQGLETMVDIIFHSDLDDAKKEALLNDALAYLNGKGYFSFKLQSLKSN